jgi:hypothetical protein
VKDRFERTIILQSSTPKNLRPLKWQFSKEEKLEEIMRLSEPRSVREKSGEAESGNSGP